MNLLEINASARVDGANSTKVANDVTARLVALHPDAKVTVRNLATDPHPVLDKDALGALFTPAEKRTAEYYKKRPCAQIVEDAVKATEKVLFSE